MGRAWPPVWMVAERLESGPMRGKFAETVAIHHNRLHRSRGARRMEEAPYGSRPSECERKNVCSVWGVLLWVVDQGLAGMPCEDSIFWIS